MVQDSVAEFPSLTVGSILGNRYRIESVIGRGAVGIVFRCSHTSLPGRVFACKVIWPHLAAKPAIVERFRREVTCALDVQHPNVLRAYDFFADGQLVGYAMEYVAGGDLAAYLKRHAPLTPAQVKPILLQLAEGMAAIHARGILHRDLKPENVFIDGSGTLKIGDFGIARLEGLEPLTPRGNLVGSLAYLAPELLSGEQPSEGSDIYSLGSIGYALLVGAPPYTGYTAAEILAIKESPDSPLEAELAQFGSSRVVDLIRQMLATRPSDRPSSMRIIAAALAGSQPSVAIVQPGPSTSVRLIVLSAILMVSAVVRGVLEFQRILTLPEPAPFNERQLAVSPTPTIAPTVVIAAETLAVQSPPTLATQFTPTPLGRVTTLRVVGGPTGTWEYGSAIKLRSVELTVRNVGSAEANGISAVVLLPGGEPITLQGPETLGANKSARYSASSGAEVRSTRQLQARVSCTNCRK